MRYQTLAAVAASIFVFAACGGGSKDNAGSTTTADTANKAGATTATTTAGSATKAPITGQTHEMQMVMDSKGYRFVPDKMTIKVGDGIKFVGVSGNPHNVAFDAAGIPAGAEAQLSANMDSTQQGQQLQSPMIMTPNQAFVVSFANLPPGVYHVFCPVHQAMGMKGEITVEK